MPDSNRDFAKAQETISELLKKLALSMNKLSNMTREDISYLRGRLDLLEYLITPKPDGAIEPVKRVSLLPCKVCGPQPLPVTVYKYQDEWYCALHLPATVTYPIGMHGDEFTAYQERKK
jgi:hypothetical protein